MGGRGSSAGVREEGQVDSLAKQREEERLRAERVERAEQAARQEHAETMRALHACERCVALPWPDPEAP